MEKSKTKLIVLIAILSLLVGGLSGYIINDKFTSKEKTSGKETITSNKSPEEINNNNYQIYSDSLKKSFSKYDDNNYLMQLVESNIIKDGYGIILDKNQNLSVEYANPTLDKKYSQSIAKNVLSFYVIGEGQGGGNNLYFINEDGTVGSANVEYGPSSNESITIKNDLGYKNIVSVQSGEFGDGLSGTHSAVFVDIDGNTFGINLK